jgi:uncharacterized protein (TIGR03663 family)
MHKKTASSLLDMPILGLVHIDLEVLLYAFLAVIAIVACFYNLGVRTQSHDECVHFLYSRELYVGDGFVHDPWRHGPFLYHINALIYFLFGVNDFTARISTALFGVILVLLPVFLRRELGRVGALLVSTLTLISPSTLYYARYIRNDIYMMVWAMLMTIALFRYLDSQKQGWLYLGAVAVTLAMCTKETAYITGFIGFVFVAMLFLRQMLSGPKVRMTYTLALVLLLVLVAVLVALNVYMDELPEAASVEGGEEATADTKQVFLTRALVKKVAEVVFLLIGILLAMLVGLVLIQRNERFKPALALLAAYVLTIGLLMALCAAVSGLVWLVIVQLPEGIVPPWLFLVLQVIAIVIGTSGGAYAWWRILGMARRRGWLPVTFDSRVMLITLLLVVVIFCVLYTTFFTNPRGLITGTVGGLTYWLAQQEVKRASQPWYYYLIIAPLYDFLPMGLSLLAIAYYMVTGRLSPTASSDTPSLEERADNVRTREAFVAYAVFWALSAWLIYSWAGEKMPWMVVHVVQPMIVLAGRFVDDLLHGVNWRKTWRRGGVVLALLVPILLLALGMVLGLPLFGQAFKRTAGARQDTYQWFLALAIGGGLFVAAHKVRARIGKEAARRVVLIAMFALGALFTARYAWMANYINYDTAKEFLVYAHGAPDVKRTVNELEAISRRLYGDEVSIEFAYTSDASWPFECYLTPSFPNRAFIGTEPTRANTDVPVLIVGRDEIDKTEPFLGDRYYRFDRKYLWFPHQDYYMNLSLAIPAEGNRKEGVNYFLLDMQDPEKRRAFWDVLFYRRYEQSLADWEPSNPGKFAFYVRKDVAAQVWDFGLGPSAEQAGVGQSAYERNVRPWDVVDVWDTYGSDDGQFNRPRNVAVGPDGAVYVLDSGNHRVQKVATDGTFLASWGHLCKMYENRAGCRSPDGAGGFYDPWGIAVDGEGYIYVADTWNHRIQKFATDGEFVAAWGQHGVVQEVPGAAGQFWGPRDIVAAPDGLIYVADTGNKRVQVFTPDGQYVAQWGGGGAADGRFDEPVGVAVGADGQTYVADTWNRRIQVFDAEYMAVYQWEVEAWNGHSLENKPYLAIDTSGRVYATDPEGARVLVFDGAGEFLASLGGRDLEGQNLALPMGIAIDEDGYIYVADPGAHRVVKLAPFVE